jgi:predicted TIM-barrel fold metal-dependent hydrolase
MDDESLAFPLFERARKRGVRTVAVHKAAPFGPVPIAPFKVDDIDLAADAFPDLAFEIIHAGLAFTEETALLLALFPNVYANLEVTSLLINTNPVQFENVMGMFLRQGGSDKIIYSDGTMVVHSQPVLESLRNYRLSEDALRRFNIPQITDEDIAKIMGTNYAKILGIDIDEAKAAIADDEFSRERARTGIQAPFSNWRAHLESEKKLEVA